MPITSVNCPICNEVDFANNHHAAGFYQAARLALNVEQNKHVIYKWKKMAMNFNNSSLLAPISTADLTANKIFQHRSCYKSVQ